MVRMWNRLARIYEFFFFFFVLDGTATVEVAELQASTWRRAPCAGRGHGDAGLRGPVVGVDLRPAVRRRGGVGSSRHAADRPRPRALPLRASPIRVAQARAPIPTPAGARARPYALRPGLDAGCSSHRRPPRPRRQLRFPVSRPSMASRRRDLVGRAADLMTPLIGGPPTSPSSWQPRVRGRRRSTRYKPTVVTHPVRPTSVIRVYALYCDRRRPANRPDWRRSAAPRRTRMRSARRSRSRSRYTGPSSVRPDHGVLTHPIAVLAPNRGSEGHSAQLIATASLGLRSEARMEIRFDDWSVRLTVLASTSSVRLTAQPGASPVVLEPGRPSLLPLGARIDFVDGTQLWFAREDDAREMIRP